MIRKHKKLVKIAQFFAVKFLVIYEHFTIVQGLTIYMYWPHSTKIMIHADDVDRSNADGNRSDTSAAVCPHMHCSTMCSYVVPGEALWPHLLVYATPINLNFSLILERKPARSVKPMKSNWCGLSSSGIAYKTGGNLDQLICALRDLQDPAANYCPTGEGVLSPCWPHPCAIGRPLPLTDGFTYLVMVIDHAGQKQFRWYNHL